MMKHASRYGLPEADLKPVEFGAVSRRIKSVIATIQEHDSVERFTELGATVKFGSAEFVDEHAIMLGGRMISARSWGLPIDDST